MSQRAQVLIKDFLGDKPDVVRIHKEWLKAKKTMGLEKDKNFVLHILRHTTATRMLDTTGNIAVVQKMLGHAKITTTMRYAHIADDKLLEAVQATSEKHNCLA
jgi:integrase